MRVYIVQYLCAVLMQALSATVSIDPVNRCVLQKVVHFIYLMKKSTCQFAT
ncbi:hypothetical protein WH47_07062 [Habropoda laboriosa]|uniref:Uncharacterized protein n=1 Tax=Habropoda laboriosa TaxID=597456 RepID=A0A0L7RFY6_9HYME|nr:hypothetical protein WH47_07062 [Habropoda laboriosa]